MLLYSWEQKWIKLAEETRMTRQDMVLEPHIVKNLLTFSQNAKMQLVKEAAVDSIPWKCGTPPHVSQSSIGRENQKSQFQ